MVIGRCNGAVLVEEGEKVSLVQQSGEYLGVALFATILGTVVLGINGVTQLFLNPSWSVGFIIGAAVFGAAAWNVKRRLSERAQAPVRESPRLVFDFEARSLKNANGEVLAGLSELWLERVFQFQSSSRALRLAWSSGSLVIARGNVFGDHVGELEDALHKRGIRVKS